MNESHHQLLFQWSHAVRTVDVRIMRLILVQLDTIKENLVPPWIVGIIHAHKGSEYNPELLRVGFHQEVFESFQVSGTL